MRWIARTFLGVFAVGWFCSAYVYLKSQQTINRSHVPEPRRVALVSGDDIQSEGARLSKVFGCVSCHGDRMQGQVLYEHALNGRITAPNLTQKASNLTLNEIEAVLRQGIKPDGSSVFVMPSASFSALTDRDFSAIYSHLLQLTPEGNAPKPMDYGLLTRYRIVRGQLPAAAEQRLTQPWRDTFRDSPRRLGEYLATVSCSQCHGSDLQGIDTLAPALGRLSNYDRVEFSELLTKGIAPAGREVAMKADLAAQRYRFLRAEEVDAIYEYLKQR